jgi:UDP-N-acetyl-D-mannosaminuronic acid dehydrogenase
MKFKALANAETTIRVVISMMASSDTNNHIPGFVVVVDENERVIGVVTDGDIRRGIENKIDFGRPVSLIMCNNPVVLQKSMSKHEMKYDIINQARSRNSDYRKYRFIIQIDEKGRFNDLVSISDIFEAKIEDRIIAVYGMGFVGLTLAAVLANSGLMVLGIDNDKKVIDELKFGRPSFYENGLESMLDSIAQSNPIVFIKDDDEFNADIHIVCVGTPVDAKKSPNFHFVNQVCKSISKRLKKGDLVIFRSTLPVGTCRNLIIPILNESGLIVGEKFFFSFAPERTVEGNALNELRTLPQIIGGYNKQSYELSSKLFSKITNTIVEVESLESAELVKLLNNTYRDLVFSFSNEVSMICEGLNINSFDLINSANEGYPRNPIPLPSPGVGGICLSKDPFLYTYSSFYKNKYSPILGLASREINSKGHINIMEKIKKYCYLSGKEINQLIVYVIGIAFKGNPETSDIRESVAINLINLLPDTVEIRVKDFVVDEEVVSSFGWIPVNDILDGFIDSDVVLFMNNHPFNNKFNILNALKLMKQPSFIFDGWNIINQKQVESFGSAIYGTHGYMTNCNPF